MSRETDAMIEARRWLNRGWKIEIEIDALTKLKRETFEAVTSITAAPDGIAVSGTRDMHKFDRVAELEDKIDRLIDEEVAVKAEIVELCESIQDRRYRVILIDRYTRFQTFEAIAVRLNYSWRQTLRLHRSALAAAYDAIQKRCH